MYINGVVYELYMTGLFLYLDLLHQYCRYVQYVYVINGVIYELYRKGVLLLLAVLHQHCRYVQYVYVMNGVVYELYRKGLLLLWLCCINIAVMYSTYML